MDERCTACGQPFEEGDSVTMLVIMKVEDGKFVPIESAGKFHGKCLDEDFPA